MISTGGLSTTVQLQGDTPYSLSFPLHPNGSGTIDLRIHDPRIPSWTRDISKQLVASNGSYVVIVADGLVTEAYETISKYMVLPDKTMLLSTKSEALPRYAASYEPVDLIVLHFAALKNLQDRQVQALSQYLTRCGKAVTLAFPESIFNRLKRLSGCQGRFLSAVSSLEQLSEDSLLPTREKIPKLPNLSDLELNKSSSDYWVAVFGMGYFLASFVTAGITRRRRVLIFLPLIGALTAVLVWGQRQPEKLLISWLEMDADHTSAQYSARLIMKGRGIWREQLELPNEMDCPHKSLDDGKTLNSADGSIVSTIRHALFSEEICQGQSTLALESPLSLSVEENLPVISNRGSVPTEKGFLRWEGRIYTLPPLQVGQKWEFNNAIGEASYSEISKVFAKQSKYDHLAVLIPFTPKIISANLARRGWLLLHGSGIGGL
ncbi:MAG: hypothetical protein ACU836_07005 [Gammaproteobacteria bacterium]